MKINNYEFGKIEIDGKEYDYDVIISFDKVDSWWRRESHDVVVEDVKKILDKKPKTIIFGTGDPGLMKVSEQTRKELENLGIEVIVEPTKTVCEIYNKLSEKPDVFAALHLTC